MNNIGNRIQDLRKKAGMSQDDLADQVGVSRQAISKWERSEAMPELYNLITISEVLNVSLDELAGKEKASNETYQTTPEQGKPRTNVLKIVALIFITLPCLLLIISIFAVILDEDVLMEKLIDYIYIFTISILYFYTTFNLFTGKNTPKYKIVAVVINIILLINLIINAILYPMSAAGVVLFIFYLILVILGIIGSVLLTPEHTTDFSDKYTKEIKSLRLIGKVITLIIGVVIVFVIVFNILTHTVTYQVSYGMKGSASTSTSCTVDLRLERDIDSSINLSCEFNDYSDIQSIELYIGTELIHSSDNITSDDFTDNYYYFSTDILKVTDMSNISRSVTVKLADSSETREHSFYINSRSSTSDDKLLPIWKDIV